MYTKQCKTKWHYQSTNDDKMTQNASWYKNGNMKGKDKTIKIMSTLEKRNPKLRNPLTDVLFGNQWLDELFNESTNSPSHFSPKADILEKEKGYLITMALPGLTKKDIKIDLTEQRLSISGGHQPITENNSAKFVSREITRGNFHREFQLNNQIDGEKIEATFKNGMLEIDLPKSEKASPKSINIK